MFTAHSVKVKEKKVLEASEQTRQLTPNENYIKQILFLC
jgi:hypothetical protein